MHVYAQSLSHVRLFVTRWTVVRQAPLSTDSPGKNTGMGGHALLQGIFLAQGLNPLLLRLLHCRQTFFTAEPLGKPQKSIAGNQFRCLNHTLPVKMNLK